MTLPRRQLAPPPGWTAETVVVIPGSGIAGLTTGLGTLLSHPDLPLCTFQRPESGRLGAAKGAQR